MPEPAAVPPTEDRWEPLRNLIDTGDAEALATFVRLIEPSDVSYTIGRLDEEARTRLLAMLSDADAELAADLMSHFVDEQAADFIEELEPEQAAAIVDEMDSDDQADVLAELEPEDADAILEKMDPEEAEDARARLFYAPDTAGGLMITEVLTAPADSSVSGVIDGLRNRAEEEIDDDYEVRYLYLIDPQHRLQGVVTLRQLLLVQPERMVSELMIAEPKTVPPDLSLDALEDLFAHSSFSAVPVVGDDGRLLGVVQHVAVQEELAEQGDEELAKVGGIVGGEELRSMPYGVRAGRRMVFLLPIMALLMASAAVIAVFEPTVQQVPILAAFLPIVAGVCGSAGNQAVAVSMREISLGLIKPGDFWYVVRKEAVVAVVNGLILGVTLMLVTWLWRGNPWLGVVVGGAVPVSLLLGACVGGSVPVVLRSMKIDPAMASGPVVTTLVDLVSFFTVLLLAAALIAKLG